MKNFLFYFYVGILFLGFFIIIYQIYNYGILGYMDKRAEMKKQRIDLKNNFIHDTLSSFL